MPTTHVLIVGSSARATAESAANAGFAVTAVDAFGDIDQHPSVRIDVPVLAPGRPYSAAAAARFARTTQADAAVYLSSFENHPRAVAALADGRALWGNAPAVLRGVRNPFLLAERMAMRGFSVPPLERGPSHPADMHTARVGLREEPARAVAAPTAWLVKPFASGGGRRVRAWHPGEATSDPRRVEKPVPADCYLQAHVDGMPGSLVFVAAGGRAVPIGFSRQLVGERAFGASGYRYCGSLLESPDATNPSGDFSGGLAGERADDTCALFRRARALASAVAEEFALTGACGIDFIARAGEPHLLEVNPRWCASMDLVERAYGLSVFGAHAAACVSGRLPDFNLLSAARQAPVWGKAIVFATAHVTIGDSRRWLGDPDVRDIPRPGTHVRAGQPICTVFAAAPDARACHEALVRRAEEIYARVSAWRRRAA